jgi:hypothetical protein
VNTVNRVPSVSHIRSLSKGAAQLLHLADELGLTYTQVYEVVNVLCDRHERRVNDFVAANAGKIVSVNVLETV